MKNSSTYATNVVDRNKQNYSIKINSPFCLCHTFYIQNKNGNFKEKDEGNEFLSVNFILACYHVMAHERTEAEKSVTEFYTSPS